MTLVVARMDGDRIAIASDTLLSKNGLPLPIDQGAIKTCIINCTVCVAFSNSPELAERDILLYRSRFQKLSGFANTVEFFKKSSRDTGNDYILAFSSPPKLVKIAGGERIMSAARTLWIGDEAAYDAFRKYSTDRAARMERGRAINAVLFADEMKESPASDLYSSMRHVVSDPKIGSVGGFVSVVSNRPEGFRYSVYSDMLYDWPKGQSDDYLLTLTDKIVLGASGENAEYCVAQLSPGYIGGNAVAFYFGGARCLFVFYGKHNGPSNRCHVFRNAPPGAVEHALFGLLGFNWRWMALVTSAPYSVGGQSPDATGVGLSFVTRLNTMPKPKP